VAASAVKAGRTPLQHCNIYVNAFQALNQRLRVKNDIYVRTTDPYHEETAKRMWKMCSDKGDIYLDAYEVCCASCVVCRAHAAINSIKTCLLTHP